MPNRIIRESCRTSETLNSLSAEAERLFWRLTTVADDYGRFEADPRVLLAQCFPLKVGALKVESVGRWFLELVTCGLVTTYDNTGKVLGFFVTWDKHQRRRARHPKYPAPTDDSIRCHVLSDVPEESRNRGIEKRGVVQNGASAPTHTPAAIAFEIPASVQQALSRAPILGAVKRLQEPAWWQAQVRANGRRGIDFAAELLKAEAWLTTNPRRAPKHDHARFLHSWLGRAEARTDG